MTSDKLILQALYEEAFSLFSEVRSCLVPDQSICAFNIYTENHGPYFQITPEHGTSYFNVLFCYAVRGWSNSAKILSNKTPAEIRQFFTLLRDDCVYDTDNEANHE